MPRAEPIVHLAFAVPKGNRADWLVEKATELGAASLRPTIFQRSVAAKEGLSPARRDRWRARCVAAAKQSGQSLLPTVEDTGSLEEVLARACGSLVLVGDVTESAEPLAQALARRYAGQPVLLVVGPEGGLTDGERGSLRAAGATWVRLGRSVLRIETAAVALLAAVLAVSEAAIPSTDNHRSH